MFLIEDLTNYLQQGNPYPCLNLLESAMICFQETEDKTIPEPLLTDLEAIFGQEKVEGEIEFLTAMTVMVRTKKGLMINAEVSTDIYALLKYLKKDLRLTLNESEETAEEFLLKLIAYLKRNASGLIVADSNDNIDFVLLWQDKKYRLQLAFSPVWLPAAADKAADQNTYLALFGPFAAQNWQAMAKYYVHPEFRNYTAYFDPWHCQKMNISKGGLFAYFDWFFRDVYGLKFFIPQSFSTNLHNMGLLRYNDER